MDASTQMMHERAHYERHNAMQAEAGRSARNMIEEGRNASPFHVLADAVERAHNLSFEVRGIADQIAGPQPEPVPTGAGAIAPSRDPGRVPSVAEIVMNLASSMIQANADTERALKRIRDVLP
jgi:hypothetical protein